MQVEWENPAWRRFQMTPYAEWDMKRQSKPKSSAAFKWGSCVSAWTLLSLGRNISSFKALLSAIKTIRRFYDVERISAVNLWRSFSAENQFYSRHRLLRILKWKYVVVVPKSSWIDALTTSYKSFASVIRPPFTHSPRVSINSSTIVSEIGARWWNRHNSVWWVR